jgi:hypothetical protein
MRSPSQLKQQLIFGSIVETPWIAPQEPVPMGWRAIAGSVADRRGDASSGVSTTPPAQNGGQQHGQLDEAGAGALQRPDDTVVHAAQ